MNPTWSELEATEQLVAGLYASMGDFDVFKRLTYLYFAAVSYSETARRGGHPERAPGFLLEADPNFGPGLRRCAAAAIALGSISAAGLERGAARRALLDDIDRTVAPYDGIGLLDESHRSWIPA